MLRGRRTDVNAIAQYPPRARMSTRSQVVLGALAVRRQLRRRQLGDTGKFMWFLTGSSLVCVPLPFFYPLALFLRFTLVF